MVVVMTNEENKRCEWFRERLADPTLLDRAVPIWVDGVLIDIAVPVGGSRRGGYVSCSSIRWAKAVYHQLSGRNGFPSVRIEYSPRRDTCHTVCWGEQPPDSDDSKVGGRFYGYREEMLQ